MRLKNIVLALGVMLAGAATIFPAQEVRAWGQEPRLVADVQCPKGSKRTGSAPTYADCNIPEDLPTKDVPTVAQTAINVAISVVGVIAVAVIVIGGILYVTSTGEAAKTKRAQNAIMYGVIGLVVAILAYAIVNFVLKSLFS